MDNSIGLWGQDDSNFYKSKIISKKSIQELPARTRLYVTKNKYHKKDDNRPEFVAWFLNTEPTGDSPMIDVSCPDKEDAETVVTLSDAVRIAQDILYDAEHGYSIDDTVVEVERFLSDVSFEAIRCED